MKFQFFVEKCETNKDSRSTHEFNFVVLNTEQLII